MEGPGYNIMKHINDKTDEILLSIKRQQENVKFAGIHSSNIIGKLRSFLLHFLKITKVFLYEKNEKKKASLFHPF